ncbi:MAG TPA: hypothetical protein VNH18_04930 [Bryobacteraceae bacterium]|nr:hypothetical protein [Bryobacteraceae bacterium]
MTSRVSASRLSVVLAIGLASFLPAVFGQNPADLFTKAPPEMDEALRSRISKFYQTQVDGHPRQSEQYVAEDSKDYFFEMRKPRILAYEIREIDYADNFTKATVITFAQLYVKFPGFDKKPLSMPVKTLWKVVDGQWYWYIDPETINDTPFGKSSSPGPPAAAGGKIPDISQGPNPESLYKQVRADKQNVRLKSGEASSDHVTISSRLPGVVTLRLQANNIPGVEIKLDHTQLKPGESATLAFHAEPRPGVSRSPFTAVVVVAPINLAIPIHAAFE